MAANWAVSSPCAGDDVLGGETVGDGVAGGGGFSGRSGGAGGMLRIGDVGSLFVFGGHGNPFFWGAWGEGATKNPPHPMRGTGEEESPTHAITQFQFIGPGGRKLRRPGGGKGEKRLRIRDLRADKKIGKLCDRLSPILPNIAEKVARRRFDSFFKEMEQRATLGRRDPVYLIMDFRLFQFRGLMAAMRAGQSILQTNASPEAGGADWGR